MKWYPSDVTRTRISVIGVNFRKILIKVQRKFSLRYSSLSQASNNDWVKSKGNRT